jgi:hypothetical protein
MNYFFFLNLIELNFSLKDKSKWPTKQNILANIQWLCQGAKCGDVLWFHFSGHGSKLNLYLFLIFFNFFFFFSNIKPKLMIKMVMKKMERMKQLSHVIIIKMVILLMMRFLFLFMSLLKFSFLKFHFQLRSLIFFFIVETNYG